MCRKRRLCSCYRWGRCHVGCSLRMAPGDYSTRLIQLAIAGHDIFTARGSSSQDRYSAADSTNPCHPLFLALLYPSMAAQSSNVEATDCLHRYCLGVEHILCDNNNHMNSCGTGLSTEKVYRLPGTSFEGTQAQWVCTWQGPRTAPQRLTDLVQLNNVHPPRVCSVVSGRHWRVGVLWHASHLGRLQA